MYSVLQNTSGSGWQLRCLGNVINLCLLSFFSLHKDVDADVQKVSKVLDTLCDAVSKVVNEEVQVLFS